MAARLQAVYPLTPLQQGLLFHVLRRPGGSAYVVQWQAELEGPLDALALRRAWEAAVACHPALRTAFAWERRDAPVQAVVSEVVLPWQQEDWVTQESVQEPVHEPAQAQEERLHQWLAEDRQQGFDLRRAPLMRLTLLRLGPALHRLVWTSHHLILDGWSTAIVLHDVMTAYADGLAGRAPVLTPPPPFQQHVQRLVQQDPALACSWWEPRLRGHPGPVDLSRLGADPHPARPHAATGPGLPLTRRADLSAQATGALRETAQRLGVTEGVLALGACLLVLQRLSGAPRPAVGVTLAGRAPSAPEADRMVGLFINTVPLVSPPMAHGSPAGRWLRSLHERVGGALAHGHLGMPEFRRLAGLADAAPLFEQLFVFENYPDAGPGPSAHAIGGLQVRVLEAQEDPDQPLAIVVAPGPAWQVRLIADPSRHDAPGLERLLAALMATLGLLGSAQDGTPLDALLPEGAAAHALLGLQGPRPALPAHTLWEAFARAAATAPNATVLEEPAGPVLTYAGLRARASAWAGVLAAGGVQPGTRVGIVAAPGAGFLAAMLAILHRGAAYVPLDPQLPLRRMQAAIDDAGLEVVFTDQPAQGWRAARILDLRDDPAGPPMPVPAPVDRHATAYLMYTSGSTGQPKGVCVPQAAVLRLVAAEGWLQPRPGARIGWAAALSFDASTLELWAALAHGGTLVVIERAALTDMARLSRELPALRLDLLWLTAGLFHLAVQEAPDALATVDTVIAGGDALDPAAVRTLLARPGPRRLLNGYGPTENTTFSTVADLRPLAGTITSAVPIGRAIAHTEVYVLDDQGRPVPPRVSGELHVGGLGLADGYWARPAETAAAFVPHPLASRPGLRLYRTGDWVHWNEHGQLVFDGRRDAQIKIRGHRVELEGVKAVLASAPGVARVHVTVEVDAAGQRQLLAHAQPHDDAADAQAWSAGVLAWAAERLPAWSLPARLHRVRHWPLTVNGKVDQRALAEQARAEAAPRPAVPAPSQDEELMRTLWTEVLGLPAAGGDTHFFESGGHSLLATVLVARVRQAFGVEVPLQLLFDAPRLGAFLAGVRQARQGEGAAEPVGPRTGSDGLPLSFAQQRLWFLDRFAPLSAAYHIPHGLHLQGRLDVHALDRALQALALRHEALRTTFDEADGRPVQRIHARLPVPLRVEQLGSEAGSALAQRMAAESELPFDLRRGPLLRAALFMLAPEDQWLLITVHHIVADGWSMGIMAREISALYRAETGHEAPALAPLPVQYADFAVWQRRWLSGDRLAAQWAHWRGRLHDAPVVEVPTDHPRPPQQSFRGGQVEFSLPPSLAASALALARRTDTTLYMVMCAAYLVLLWRLTGQRDLLLGTPVAGRSRLEVQGLVGFFVNLLPMRVTLDEHETGRSLLAKVRETALQAFDHQELPFEMLVEQLSPSRDPSRQPLVQLTLAVHNVPGGELDLPGLTLQDTHTQLDWVRFDLELHAWQRGHDVVGYWAYARDLYRESTVQRLQQLLEHVLGELATDPQRRLTHMPLADEAMRLRLQAQWCSSARPRPEAPFVHDEVALRARDDAQALAIVQGPWQMTRGALQARSGAVAHRLARQGLQPDDRIGLLLERTPDFVAAMLGIVRAGGAYVPLDPAWPPARLAQLCKAAGIRQLWVQPGTRAAAEAAELGDVLVHDIEALPAAPAGAGTPPAPPRVRDGQQGAYVIATSGSTGQPKPVLVTHGALANHMRWMASVYPLGPGDRVLQRTASTFDASVWEFWAPLMQGVPLLMAAPGLHADPHHLVQVMSEQGVTVAQFVPTVLGMVLDQPDAGRCTALRRVFAGGEPLTWALVERARARWQAEVVNLYGPTEVTIDALSAVWPQRREEGEPIGVPIDGLRAAVVDEALQPLPPGVAGELLLGGEGVARGYLGMPAATAERFVPDPWGATPGARVYRTGDRVRQREDGRFDYLGRMDRQVKYHGQRLELGEVEAVLRGLAGVADALVRLREPSDLVAYVVPSADALDAGTADGDGKELTRQGVHAWREMYRELYAQPGGADPEFDITGWTSSYTGIPLPEAQMRRWRDATVERIAALAPRRLFEIGCGTGLLLFPLAPRLQRYQGIDFSTEVVARTQARAQRRGWQHVELHALPAHEALPHLGADVDTVVLNSVVQYFPSLAYLTDVLVACAGRIAPGGRLFIGDVRHAGLLEAYHASVQLARSTDDEPLAAVAARARAARLAEEELALDPGYFEQLFALMPRLAHVEVRVKPLRDDNELARYRYDVVLCLDEAQVPEGTAVAGQPDTEPGRGPADLHTQERLLRGAALQAPRVVTRVANGRLLADARIASALRDATPAQTAGALRRELEAASLPPDPEDWCEAGARLGLAVAVDWDPAGRQGQLRVTFVPPGSPMRRQLPPGAGGHAADPRGVRQGLRRWAHDPLPARWSRSLVPGWRAALAQRLPAGFLPSAIVCLPEWPTLASGKRDLRALPVPDREGLAAHAAYQAPEGPQEEAVARVWAQVLGLSRVGRHDNFFDLGGHSLLAVMLSSALARQLGLRLSVADVFRWPTVAEQAGRPARTEALAEPAADDDGAHRPLLPASGPPVFAFPPLLGWGIAFLELARALPRWQVWALDFEDGVADPVDACVQLLERAQPAGDLRLLAYSAGARLAFEAILRLERMGRRVAVLVCLDGEIAAPAATDEAGREAILHENLVHFEAALQHRPELAGTYRTLGMREALAQRMRAYMRYLDRPLPTTPITAPVVHIRSSAAAADRSPWQGWTRGPIQGLQGHGPHEDMTLPPYAAHNAELVEQALRQPPSEVTTPGLPRAAGP